MADAFILQGYRTLHASQLTENGALSVKGAGDFNDAVGQTFSLPTTQTIRRVQLKLNKTNAPDDGLVVKIYSGSFTGTLLATSAIYYASSGLAPIYPAAEWIEFDLDADVSCTGGTTYYLVCERTGGLDAINRHLIARWDGIGGVGAYPDGGGYRRDAVGGWILVSADFDYTFKLEGPLTATTDRYLLEDGTGVYLNETQPGGITAMKGIALSGVTNIRGTVLSNVSQINGVTK